jgi:two-component system response regulator MprA
MSQVDGRPGAEGTPVLLVGEAAAALAPRLALSGYRPLEAPAAGGSEGVAGVSPPRVVVLAPGGETEMAALRRAWGAVPILLGLQGDSLEARVRCLACGADDFWLTDRPPSDLLARLRLHLQRRHGEGAMPAANELRLGDLVLDPSRRRVWRGGRELALTEREYQLLALLLRHRGEVVSRERILSSVWEEGGGATSNVIEVYVRYLRQKLEAHEGRRLLHTVRGRGYCLAEHWPPAGEAA